MSIRLLLLGVLWPGVAGAQSGDGPAFQHVADNVASCLSNTLEGRLVGRVWVEPSDRGYRVVMSIWYLPRSGERSSPGSTWSDSWHTRRCS